MLIFFLASFHHLCSRSFSYYLVSVLFLCLDPSQYEFYVLQGTDSYATITVRRNTKIFAGEVCAYCKLSAYYICNLKRNDLMNSLLHHQMEIEYATSDLTAKGVDSTKYEACLAQSPAERGPAVCGDYEQTTGRIHFNEGDNSGGFYVNILNYQCAQPYLKFFQV